MDTTGAFLRTFLRQDDLRELIERLATFALFSAISDLPFGGVVSAGRADFQLSTAALQSRFGAVDKLRYDSVPGGNADRIDP